MVAERKNTKIFVGNRNVSDFFKLKSIKTISKSREYKAFDRIDINN